MNEEDQELVLYSRYFIGSCYAETGEFEREKEQYNHILQHSRNSELKKDVRVRKQEHQELLIGLASKDKEILKLQDVIEEKTEECERLSASLAHTEEDVLIHQNIIMGRESEHQELLTSLASKDKEILKQQGVIEKKTKECEKLSIILAVQ